jgi:LuxR family transcriptional regulator
MFFRSDRELNESECETIYEALRELHHHSLPARLTNAELEALELIKRGLRFKQIAHEIGISQSAVKARLVSVRAKLGAQSTAQAVGLALRHGLLAA